jgi:hypothetical protein
MIQGHSRLFKVIQCYSMLFNVVQGCSKLFKNVQSCSRLFNVVQSKNEASEKPGLIRYQFSINTNLWSKSIDYFTNRLVWIVTMFDEFVRLFRSYAWFAISPGLNFKSDEWWSKIVLEFREISKGTKKDENRRAYFITKRYFSRDIVELGRIKA